MKERIYWRKSNATEEFRRCEDKLIAFISFKRIVIHEFTRLGEDLLKLFIRLRGQLNQANIWTSECL